MSSGRILLVEDAPHYVRPLTGALERGGFGVTLVSSPAAVAQQLQAGKCFDLAIVDLDLPSGPLSVAGVAEGTPNVEMGWRALEIIREAAGPNTDIPAIVLSAYTDLAPADRYEPENLRKLGVRAVLRKRTVTPAELLDMVRRCLTGDTPTTPP